MTNNETLIRRVLEGDRDRYGDLVEPHIDQLHAISYSYLGDAQAAEDVTQDALIKAFTALRTLADPRKFVPWLRQITRNMSRSAARRRKFESIDPEDYRDMPDSSAEDPGVRVQAKEAGDLLKDALARISPKLSETIVLFYLKDQSIRQIAEFLEISENTVKQRLHRGRALLRERLQDMVLEDGRRKIELSADFLPGVIAVLPGQPAAGNLFAGALGKLASLPMLWPLLSPLLVAMLCSGLAGWLLVSDVDPSNRPARKSMWQSTMLALVVTAGIVLAVFAVFSQSDSPHFLIILLLVFLLPFGFMAFYFLRAGATGRMKLSFFAPMGVIACLGCIMAFPQHALVLWAGLFLLLAGAQAANISWQPALARRKEPSSPAEDSSDTGPVPIAFLRDAGDFLKMVNTPFPLFHNITKEEGHVCFSAHPRLVGKLIRRLSKLTERWRIPWCRIGSARLYPDGTVEYDVYSKSGFPPHWGSVEEEEERVRDYITRCWASFTAGDEAGARSLTPDLFPEKIYTARRGRRTLAIVMVVGVAIMIAAAVYLLTQAG